MVGPTPALRGYPGGPGLDLPPEDTPGPLAPESRELSPPSVWQQSQQAWRAAGIEWQRTAADWEPAEPEWEPPPAPTPSGWRRREPGRERHALAGAGAWLLAAGALARARLATRRALIPRGGLDPEGTLVPGSGLRGRLAGTFAGRLPAGRRRAWQVGIAVLIIAVLIIVAFLVFGGGSSPAGSGAAYPPARLAGADFSVPTAQDFRGVFQSVSAVAASGRTVVAVGSEVGQWLPRAEFLVSADSGRSWRLARVRGPGGAVPSPSDLPQLVAGGPVLPSGRAGWLAVGPGATWTSRDGISWTLARGTGISPLRTGDRVLALARTAGGFIAVGENAAAVRPGRSMPVAWTSPDGLAWKRLAGSGLHLAAARGRVIAITRVAARGADEVVEGEIAGRARGGAPGLSSGLWQSSNGGATWVPSRLPPGSGPVGRLDGIAATSAGFVAIRGGGTGRAASRPGVYASADGTSWTRAATLTAAGKGSLRITAVGGSGQGAVAAGRVTGGTAVGFVSTNGRSWRMLTGLAGPRQALSGLTVATGGTVVAAGATLRTPEGQQPYLAVAGSRVRDISVAGIPGAFGPSLGISALAVAGRTKVAVGTAAGLPAIWSTAGGRWKPVAAAALGQPGLGALASVVHGRAGWLAVGGATPGGLIAVTSRTGASWRTLGASALAGQGVTASQAAAGRAGYVIVGRQVLPAATVVRTTVTHGRKHRTSHITLPRTVAAAWWSQNLTSWTRAASGLGGPGPRQMTAVTAGGPGFVAAGSAGSAPAVWTSAGGMRWKLRVLPVPRGASAALLGKVAARGRVIVATGTQTRPAGTLPLAEYSADGGATWHQAPLTAPGGPAAVTALTAAAGGFVAVGTAGQPGSQRVVVWTSRDGSSWRWHEPPGTGLAGPGSHAITALTASGRALTGAGYVATPMGEQPTLWNAAAG